MRYPSPRTSQPGAPSDPRGGNFAERSAPASQPDGGASFESSQRRQPFPRFAPPAERAGPSAERMARADQMRRAGSSGIEAPAPNLDRDGILQRYRNASPAADSPAAQRTREMLGQPPRMDPSQARIRSRDEQLRRGAQPAASADAQRSEDRLRAERAASASRQERARGQLQGGTPSSQGTLAEARNRAAAAGVRPSREATERFIAAEKSVVNERTGAVRLDRARERTEALRREAAVNSPRFREAQAKGEAVARATDIAIGVGLSTAGCYYAPSVCNPCYPYSGWWFWWGYGGYPYSPYCHPFGWSYWWWWGYWPLGISYWYPYSYYSAYSYPGLYYPTAIYNYYYDTQQSGEGGYTTYEEQPQQPQPEPYAEPVGEASAPPSQPVRSEQQASSNQFLSLGDQAFRAGRYADAVHYYARAVELAPGQGVLYLVLADGLFATGDYHYGAYALRKALDLEPQLALSDVDKHSFYGDPADFDRQIAVLEQYVLDRPGSSDARLMLAANYLFGGQPAAAVDLLEREENTDLRRSISGSLILDAARKSQLGKRR